ncbi:unnamed protein product [Discosporangium mesarthrocarpum]
MARATHGVHTGKWYWECTVLPPALPNGHCRLGWTKPTGAIQAPVGYDESSFAYRDLAGSRITQSRRHDGYGAPYSPGDVIGMYIHVSPLGHEEAW